MDIFFGLGNILIGIILILHGSNIIQAMDSKKEISDQKKKASRYLSLTLGIILFLMGIVKVYFLVR